MEKNVFFDKLVEEMKAGTASDEEKEAVLGRYMNELSTAISAAICPITIANSPFIIAMLEMYAEQLRKDIQCNAELIRLLKETERQRIMIVGDKNSENGKC